MAAMSSGKLLQAAITLASIALVSAPLARAAGGGDLPDQTTLARELGKSAPSRPARKTAPPLNKNAPISVDASRMEGDYGTHHLILHQPVISQNDLRITAERADATGLDFQNSRWIFTGDVHLSSEYRGKLDSDEAVVDFRDNQIQSAVATGHPAQFEQTDSTTGVLARGHADNIQYAVAAGTIRLTMDAWLKYGDNDEITAPVLVYNIKEQKLEGASLARPGERVHIVIVPKKSAVVAPRTGPSRPKPTPKPGSQSQSSSAAQSRSAAGRESPP
jgi:lipopolysaccharide transport protein LptA